MSTGTIISNVNDFTVNLNYNNNFLNNSIQLYQQLEDAFQTYALAVVYENYGATAEARDNYMTAVTSAYNNYDGVVAGVASLQSKLDLLLSSVISAISTYINSNQSNLAQSNSGSLLEDIQSAYNASISALEYATTVIDNPPPVFPATYQLTIIPSVDVTNYLPTPPTTYLAAIHNYVNIFNLAQSTTLSDYSTAITAIATACANATANITALSGTELKTKINSAITSAAATKPPSLITSLSNIVVNNQSLDSLLTDLNTVLIPAISSLVIQAQMAYIAQYTNNTPTQLSALKQLSAATSTANDVAISAKNAITAVLSLFNSSNTSPTLSLYLSLSGPVTQAAITNVVNASLQVINAPPVNLSQASINTILPKDAFQLKELVQIYNYPAPDTSISPVVFVVSLGGGLYGASYTPAGLLIADGKNDIHKTWKNQGIHPSNYPAVYVVNNFKPGSQPVAANNLDTSATLENTLDVATIGACCPNPNLTIVLFVFDDTKSTVAQIETALEGTIIGGKLYKPSVISISWGTPESIVELKELNRINSILRQAAIDGIQVCAASGDGGSTLNVEKNALEVLFPASSPYVTAVGGTTLTCPSNNYSDSTTIEVVWNNKNVGGVFRASGGGSSKFFLKPQYQQNLLGTYRQVPDIAMCADPGVVIVYQGQPTVVGGTSLATPLYAALLTCLKTPTRIPQLNVTQATSYFNDITVGYNYNASVYPNGIVDPVTGSTTKQYVATVGYDNCTGLGSIDGKALGTILSGFPRFLTTVTQYFVEPTNINNLPMNVTEVYTFITAQTTNIYLVRLIDVANSLCLLGRTTSSNIINEALSAQSFGEGLLYAVVSLASYINPLNPLTQGALSIGGAIYLIVYTILNPPSTVINPTIGEPATDNDIGDPVDLQGTPNTGAGKFGSR